MQDLMIPGSEDPNSSNYNHSSNGTAWSTPSTSQVPYSNLVIGNGSPQQFLQVTDKSCVACRGRKVRCDRLAAGCLRCKNRNEQCVYDKGVALVMRRVADAMLDPVISKSEILTPGPIPLQHHELSNPNIATLSHNQYSSHPSSSSQQQHPQSVRYPPPLPHQNQPQYHPHQQVPQQSIQEYQQQQPFQQQQQQYQPYNQHDEPPQNQYLSPRSKYVDYRKIAGEVSSQWDYFMSNANIGHQSVDWQLAKPAMAKSLTITLLEASMDSCCLHLKAFHNYRHRISYFCEHLGGLSPSEEAAVTILTSLGARASPHSALLGVAGPDIENGKSTRALNLSAGVRRENAWKAIVDRAVDQCSNMNTLHSPTRENIEILVAMSNTLLFSEVLPDRSRLFHRIAVGLFQDLQRSDSLTDHELDDFKAHIGPSLYETDSRISAYASLPFLIREIDDDLDGTSVILPDLNKDDLGLELDRILKPHPTSGGRSLEQVEEALSLSGYYVCALQRGLATLTSARRSTAYLTSFESFWAQLDRVHGAVQSLHRLLDNLSATGCAVHGHSHENEHDMAFNRVLSVRLDMRIVDLINLSHCFLEKQRGRLIQGTEDYKTLERILDISLKRVRKGLKLMAYYAKFLADGVDKHVVYHLITQIEVIPWVLIAVQRVGESNGPTTKEFEVSETELDWYSEALEMACFFTPLAAKRLDQMVGGRNARRQFAPMAVDNTYTLPSPIASAGISTGGPTYSDYGSPYYPANQRTHRHSSFGSAYPYLDPSAQSPNSGGFLREIDPTASADFLAGFDFDAMRRGAGSVGGASGASPGMNSNLPAFDEGMWNGTVQW